MNEKIAYRVVDTPTPRYVMFSGRFKRFEKGLLIIYYIFIACFIFFLYCRSNAYREVQEHLPVMVTQIIDNLSRNKEAIVKKYGEVGNCDFTLNLYIYFSGDKFIDILRDAWKS